MNKVIINLVIILLAAYAATAARIGFNGESLESQPEVVQSKSTIKLESPCSSGHLLNSSA
ncbi:hypothetical protein L9F63_018954, partial [Diploptera punctata]